VFVLAVAAGLVRADVDKSGKSAATGEVSRLFTAVGACPSGIVRVEVGGAGNFAGKTGNGVLLADGRILTAAHLLEGASAERPVRVFFGGSAGGGAVAQGRLEWRRHASSDVAVILGASVPEGVAGVELAEASPKDGDVLMIVGREPEGGVHVYAGALSGRDDAGPRLHMSVSTQPGDSGAPVFGTDGRLVGILSGAGRVSRSTTTTETTGAQTVTETRTRQIPAAFAVDLPRVDWKDMK
jgi:S1-C subfamily serine protease